MSPSDPFGHFKLIWNSETSEVSCSDLPKTKFVHICKCIGITFYQKVGATKCIFSLNHTVREHPSMRSNFGGVGGSSQIKQTNTIRWVRPLGYSLDLSLFLSYMLLSLTAMAIPVAEFLRMGYKIRNIFC